SMVRGINVPDIKKPAFAGFFVGDGCRMIIYN
ncbi:MAG: hypothetical protein ACI8SJ_001489, partial [Shewanella sp.]